MSDRPTDWTHGSLLAARTVSAPLAGDETPGDGLDALFRDLRMNAYQKADWDDRVEFLRPMLMRGVVEKAEADLAALRAASPPVAAPSEARRPSDGWCKARVGPCVPVCLNCRRDMGGQSHE